MLFDISSLASSRCLTRGPAYTSAWLLALLVIVTVALLVHPITEYSTAEKRFGMKGPHCWLERETERTSPDTFWRWIMPGRRSTTVI
jgi:hypothetical protein